jgi:hypothetical protein
MSCCLTPSVTAKEDFTGTTGCQVTLKLKAPSDTGASLVNVRYAGDDITASLQFNIKTGAKMLVVLAEASQPGALLQLVESCDATNEQVLDRFHYDPMNPARGYIVRGSAA